MRYAAMSSTPRTSNTDAANAGVVGGGGLGIVVGWGQGQGLACVCLGVGLLRVAT